MSVVDAVEVPDEPGAFFEGYLPARFEALRELVPRKTSIGSVTARVVDAGEWSLRLREGDLEISRGMEDDVVLQLTIPAVDFAPLVVESARRAANAAVTSQGILRALSVDAETARLVRHVPGSVLLAVRDADRVRQLLLSPGRRIADLDMPDCTIACEQADFIAMQTGQQQPMQLFTAGKLRLTGNVQIALALAGLFV